MSHIPPHEGYSPFDQYRVVLCDSDGVVIRELFILAPSDPSIKDLFALVQDGLGDYFTSYEYVLQSIERVKRG